MKHNTAKKNYIKVYFIFLNTIKNKNRSISDKSNLTHTPPPPTQIKDVDANFSFIWYIKGEYQALSPKDFSKSAPVSFPRVKYTIQFPSLGENLPSMHKLHRAGDV